MLLAHGDKVIAKIAKKVFFKVQKLLVNLKKIRVNILHILPVKFMEYYGKIGGCGKVVLITTSIFRKMGYSDIENF